MKIKRAFGYFLAATPIWVALVMLVWLSGLQAAKEIALISLGVAIPFGLMLLGMRMVNESD